MERPRRNGAPLTGGVRLGVTRRTAWRRVYEGRKSLWASSHDPAVDRELRNAFFAERGLDSLAERFAAIWAEFCARVHLLLSWDSVRS